MEPNDRDLAALLDVTLAAQQVQRYCQGLDRAQFNQDDEKQAAVLYRVGVIGEAIKRISPAFRNQYPNIPWKQIAGMRDIVMHQYDRVNLELVWDVVQSKIPELLTAIEPLIPPEL